MTKPGEGNKFQLANYVFAEGENPVIIFHIWLYMVHIYFSDIKCAHIRPNQQLSYPADTMGNF